MKLSGEQLVIKELISHRAIEMTIR
jgi:hypothetical protein